MKKVKVERKNSETGEDEAVALNVVNRLLTASPKIHVKKEIDELAQSSEIEKICDNPISQDEPTNYESKAPIVEQQQQSPSQQQVRQQQQIQQQQQQQAQPQQQQFPANIPRALPPGAPANYCNICNKELCNKYFMKTHMQKMHGINLDDYPREAANSGGVVCDICQKELCSKYFLKVHKSNTHGITDLASGSAGTQAANAATAVAAIATLTNYSLNNAQRRAALNLAINVNQHQLQSRQATALVNAAASAAFNPLHMAQAARAAAHQRERMNANSILGHLQQQQQQQPIQQLDIQQTQQHRSQQQLQNSTILQQNNLVGQATNFHASLPAALLAATANNPLLAAQLAAHQHHFSTLSSQQQQHQQQQTGQQHQPTLFLPQSEDSPDTEEDTSDRDSLADQSIDNQSKNHLAMSNFQQHLQNQQALLNAAAVFNPAAAAAAMLAMQQQQQQLQAQQQQHPRYPNEQSFNVDDRQQAAMDLRSQSISQLIAQQMISAQQQEHQHQQLNNDCILNNDTAQFVATPIYHNVEDTVQSLQNNQVPGDEEEEEEEEDEFDSDRDSLVDEGIFRQATSDASVAPLQLRLDGGIGDGGGNTTTTSVITTIANSNNNNGSLIGSSISNENDMEGLINCANDYKRRTLLASHSSVKAQQLKTSTTKHQITRNNSNSNSPNNSSGNSNNTNNNSSNNNILPSPITNLLVASSLVTNNTPQRAQGNQGNNSNTGSNNSRYLRHYTEACPICDRRFKSIKWLQSHVTNDHKNECRSLFEAYVQALLCSNNGNNIQAAAALLGNVPSSGGASAALTGVLANLVNADLQQQVQQQQTSAAPSATSTANRDA